MRAHDPYPKRSAQILEQPEPEAYQQLYEEQYELEEEQIPLEDEQEKEPPTTESVEETNFSENDEWVSKWFE